MRRSMVRRWIGAISTSMTSRWIVTTSGSISWIGATITKLNGMRQVFLLTLGQAMDQQQAEQFLLGRVLELSAATAEAARTSASAMGFLKQQADQQRCCTIEVLRCLEGAKAT